MHIWLLLGYQISDLPIDVLYGLADYFPKRNKFYQQYNQTYDLDQIYRRAIAAIAPLELKNRKTKLFVPNKYGGHAVWRPLFEEALYLLSASPTSISVLKIEVPIHKERFPAHLMAIIKHTENIFRDRVNFRPQLRNFKIIGEWQAILNKKFALTTDAVTFDEKDANQPKKKSQTASSAKSTAAQNQPPQIAAKSASIAIDWTLAEQLAEQSREVRTRLIVDESDQDMQEEKMLLLNHALSSDQLQSLTTNDTKLLKLLRSCGWEAETDELQRFYENEFIHVIMDRLNEWAYEVYGDVMIVQEGQHYILLVDYREDIAYLLDKPSQT